MNISQQNIIRTGDNIMKNDPASRPTIAGKCDINFNGIIIPIS